MDDRDSIDGLFDEIGPLLEPDYVAASGDGTVWEVRLSADTVVTASLDAGAGMLTFAIRLGEIAEAHVAGHHVGMLQFNALLTRTDGAQLALDARGEAVLLQRCRADRFDAQALIARLRELGERARAWRAILSATPADAGETQTFMPGARHIQA